MASNDTESRVGYTFSKPEGLLAHYTTAAVAFEHVLPERRLRLSPYRLMRDPAENKDLIPGTGYFGDVDNPGEALADATVKIKRLRNGCRVLSLTHDAEDATDTFGC